MLPVRKAYAANKAKRRILLKIAQQQMPKTPAPLRKKPPSARAQAKIAKEKRVNRTSVTFLLDRTGSMLSIKEATIAGFNTYLDGLKKSAHVLESGAAAWPSPQIDFTLIQFDSVSVDKLCVRKPVREVENRTEKNYQPRGGTPLIDAAVETIRAVEASLVGEKLQPKVVICIQTDGEENASKEHTWEELQALIAEKTKLGWQFNFIGAGIDAYVQGAKMGISSFNTMSYQTDVASTRAAFAANASNTVSYAAGQLRSTEYTAQQKKDAGDTWQKDSSTPPAPTVTSKKLPRVKITL